MLKRCKKPVLIYGYDSLDEIFKINPNLKYLSIGGITNIFNKNQFKKHIKLKDNNFVYL